MRNQQRRRLIQGLLAALIVQIGLVGCSSGGTLTANPGLRDDKGAERLHQALARGAAQAGLASWYGPQFHGRRTANGETFDMDGISAAHKTLPFGTVVLVKNLDNGKRLEVRINDRGPFIRGRIIDLSRGAAQLIGLTGPGIARVEVSVVSWPGERKPARTAREQQRAGRQQTSSPAASDAPRWVQAGAFKERRRAQALATRLAAIDSRFKVYSTGGWHRVQARLDSADEATALVERLRADGVDAVTRSP